MAGDKKPIIDNTKETSYRGQDTITLDALNIVDLQIEGLEKERDAWKNICLEGTAEEVTQATEEYIDKIEEATNQPLSIMIKKAQFVDLNDSIIIDRDPGKRAMIRMRDDQATGKGLHEKAKSSVKGEALAGYIPVNQAFGKAGDSGRTDRFNQVVHQRFDNQAKEIEKLDEFLTQLNQGTVLNERQQRDLKNILSNMPVAKIQLKDKAGNEIYGFREEDKEPIFAIKQNGKFLDEKTKKPITLLEGQNFEKIKVLSYITGIENIGGNFQLKTQKITGDHDQLAIGTKATRRSTLQDKELSGERGNTDPIGHAVTTALIDETKQSGAVRHGQDAGGSGTKNSLSKKDLEQISLILNETGTASRFLENEYIKDLVSNKLGGNPYPEDFTEGNYAIYMPNKVIDIAHTESQLVEKYNKLEAMGYHIGINPNYGWKRTSENKLEIDPCQVSAQKFLNAKDTIAKHLHKTISQNLSLKDRVEEIVAAAQSDANQLYKMNSILSLVKLQSDSPEKRAAVTNAEQTLHSAEKEYATIHKLIPPTVLALVNPETRQEQVETMNHIITKSANNTITAAQSEAEAQYATDHNFISPTVTALVNPETRQEQLDNMNQNLARIAINKELETKKLRSHSVTTLPEENLTTRVLRSQTIADIPANKAIIDSGMAIIRLAPQEEVITTKAKPALGPAAPKRGIKRGG